MLQWQQKVSVTIYPDATSAVDLHPETALVIGECRSKEGGGGSSETGFVRPGNMAPGVAMPGPDGYDEMTLRRWIQHGTDSGLNQQMLAARGSRVVIVAQPLDAKRRAGFHRPVTTGGVLGNVSQPDFDPDSTDAMVVEFTVQPDSIT